MAKGGHVSAGSACAGPTSLGAWSHNSRLESFSREELLVDLALRNRVILESRSEDQALM